MKNNVTPFKNGQGWESDFDYDGMLKFASKVKHTDSLTKLKKLGYSFTDVNYHSTSGELHRAINLLESGNKDIKDCINNFVQTVKSEIAYNDKVEKFLIKESSSTYTTIYFDSKRLCSLNKTSKLNNIIQFSENENQLFDVELMKFFVKELLGKTIKSIISTSRMIEIQF